MQDCFRAHPDVYGSELEESEIDDELAEDMAGEKAPGTEGEGAAIAAAAQEPATPDAAAATASEDTVSEMTQTQRDVEKDIDSQDTIQAPREWHNATQKNPETEEKEGQGETKQKQ